MEKKKLKNFKLIFFVISILTGIILGVIPVDFDLPWFMIVPMTIIAFFANLFGASTFCVVITTINDEMSKPSWASYIPQFKSSCELFNPLFMFHFISITLILFSISMFLAGLIAHQAVSKYGLVGFSCGVGAFIGVFLAKKAIAKINRRENIKDEIE